MDKDYSLKRSDIIRGFNRFNYILEKGQKVLNGNLIAYYSIDENFSDRTLQAGFLISKKKLKNLTNGIILSGF